MISRSAAFAAALWLLLTSIGRIAAEEPSMQRLFEGVRRGAATPEVLRGSQKGQPSRAQSPGQRPAAQRTGQLQQPDGWQVGVVPAANGQAAGEPESGGEPLPMPVQTPSSNIEGTLPMIGWDANVDISQGRNGRIDRLVVRDAALSKVLALLAQTYHLNIVASNDIDATISITLRDVALDEALTAILSVANYTWVDRDGIILITSLTDTAQLAPGVQGREMQIFDLDFASAATISEAINGFLSPIGKMSIVESDPTDNRRTREMIVIEDIPEAIARVAAYIEQVDCPPRQVQIEA